MRYTIFVAMLLLAHTTQAQSLSFAQAKEEMLANNLEIKAARQAVEAAQLELRATRGLRLPNIDFIASYTLMQHDISIDLGGSKGALNKFSQDIINKGINNGIITQSIANMISEGLSPLLAADWSYTLQKRSTFMGAATITQPIYTGGRIEAAIKASEIAANCAEYNLQAIINSKTTMLVEYYYGTVLAEYDVKLRESAVAGIRQHLHDAQAMEEEGVIPHSEVLYVQFRLSEAERELATSTSKLTLAREALGRILNRECSEKLTDRIFVVNSIYNIDYYIENSININPIILDARGNIALSEQRVKLTKAALLPEIAAMGGAIVASHNLTNMLPRWSIGIGLRLNIFDGLGKERRLAAANKANEAIYIVAEETTNSITLITENEYYNTTNSLKDVAMMKSSIEFARAYLATKIEGFKEGLTPSRELIDAQLELQATELKQLAAAYDFCKSLARLLEISGLSDTFIEYQQKAILL